MDGRLALTATGLGRRSVVSNLSDGAGMKMLLVRLAQSPGLELTGGVPGWIEVVMTGDLGQSSRMPPLLKLMQVCPGCEGMAGACLAGSIGGKAVERDGLGGHWNNSRKPELGSAWRSSVAVATKLWVSSWLARLI